MAQPLKDQYGPQMPAQIAAWMVAAWEGFDSDGFLAGVLPDYQGKPLLGRARLMADELVPRLPPEPARAVRLITAALPPKHQCATWSGMQPFVLLPLGMAVADIGLDCFGDSMVALREITERFTSEFSLRTFIEHRYEPTMAQLREWTGDPSEHVRRLVSEGTRPRLPWAPRLQRFVDDPEPVLDLLERLKDDPSQYVRRSVANNLNDISKDHPHAVIQTAQRWSRELPDQRRDIVHRGLRTLIKAGDPEALRVVGVVSEPGLSATLRVEPAPAHVGGRVRLSVVLRNDAPTPAVALADIVVSFVKANGSTSPKVFKGSLVEVPGNSSVYFTRTVSLAQHTTRSHYPGMHRAAVLLNGATTADLAFDVLP
jgi:3-methyladenine DNA glycosylase AlkC